MPESKDQPHSLPPSPAEDETASLPAVDADAARLQQLAFQDSGALEDLWGGLPDDDDVAASIAGMTGRGSKMLPKNIGKTLSDLSGDDKYVVEHEIGEGGMGRVLRALDRDIRRPVAMKVIQDKEDPEHRARFVEEAQVTGQLEHPNIVPIHELGLDSEGRLFFTMKLLRGKNLGEILDEIREYPAVEAARYPLSKLIHALIHACNAVAFAHARGVVHRDLKPGNIWVGEYGEVYVMDWGCAKVGAANRDSQRIQVKPPKHAQASTAPAPVQKSPPSPEVISYRSASHLCITVHGTVVGTPAYMAPEQAGGQIESIDQRSDIYALGAILYEMLTLHPPVHGRSDKEFIEQAKLGRILPPRRRAPHRPIPAELAAIAMKALQHDPKDRYQKADAFQADLTRFVNRLAVANAVEPLGVGLLRLTRQHIGKALVLAILTLGVAAGAGWLAARHWAAPLPGPAVERPAPSLRPTPDRPPAEPEAPAPVPRSAPGDDPTEPADTGLVAPP